MHFGLDGEEATLLQLFQLGRWQGTWLLQQLVEATTSELFARGRAQQAVRIRIASVHGHQRLVICSGILVGRTRHHDQLILAIRSALLFLLLVFFAQQRGATLLGLQVPPARRLSADEPRVLVLHGLRHVRRHAWLSTPFSLVVAHLHVAAGQGFVMVVPQRLHLSSLLLLLAQLL